MLKTYTTEFLAYCKLAGFSDKSVESLSSSLRELTAFVKTLKINSIEIITYGDLSQFVADFNEPSVHKKKARVWCLHQLFHFLTVSGYVKQNIALQLPYPKIEKTIPHFLTKEELNRLIEYFSQSIESSNGFRNLVIILMLGLLGLRTGTLVALNVEHIDIEAGLAWIQEKGRRKRYIVLPQLLVKVLNIYLLRLEQTHGPLFLSTRKKRISPRIMQDIFHTAADNLGIEKRLHARLFRHTAATHLNKVAGTDITKEVLGHERRQNTLKYAHLNPDQYAVYMKRHPYMGEVQP